MKRMPKIGTLGSYLHYTPSMALGNIRISHIPVGYAGGKAIRSSIAVPNQYLPFRSGNVLPNRYIPLFLYKTVR